MNGLVFGRICWILTVMCLLSASLAHGVMPLPTGSQVYSYPLSEFPAVHADPSEARPIGVGDVINAHDLNLRIGLDGFPSPVDIYAAIYAPAVFPDLLLIHSNGNLAPVSAGFYSWRAGTSGPVSEGLFGTIPLSLLPSGDYGFYLLVAPAGTPAASLTGKYYLWMTSVGNLRVLDVSEKASSLFGGDVEAAAAILMALGNDYSLENVANAVMRGTLTEYGEILAATTAKQILASGMPSFCNPEQSPQECRDAMRVHLNALHQELLDVPFNKRFNKLVTAYTLYLGGLGYSGTQIHAAIWGNFVTGEVDINVYQSTEDFPFGGIMTRWCESPGSMCEEFVKPAIDRSGIPALFSDLDPKDFDIPSTEGMTFPKYYKGTGTARIHYSNPNSGSVDCTLDNLVIVAKVGGIGIWEGLLKIHSDRYPHYTSTGDLKCQPKPYTWKIAEGQYGNDGTYHEVFQESTYSGAADVKFNEYLLWGSVTGTQTIAVYGGSQVTRREWQFELETATEAEYNAVVAH